MVAARKIELALAAVLLIALIPVLDQRSAQGGDMRSGGIIGSYEFLMTSTATPDYFPPAGSPAALKLYYTNRALRNRLAQCPSYVCTSGVHQDATIKHAETTTVIGPGSGAGDNFDLVSGTALPVGFKFAGRGGRPGNPGQNPVNLAGAPDYGTETVHVCYNGVFIGGFSDTCKWMRESRSGDSGLGTGSCPAHNTTTEATYGGSAGDGIPHIALMTNDAGPVNRTWGPIPGGTGDTADYAHPNGRLWDVRRQKWAYARWTAVTCAGLTVGGLGGNQRFTFEHSIFIYKDEPYPGAWTLSMMWGPDDRLGASSPDNLGEGFKSCGGVMSTPPNPCRTTHEMALQFDLGGAVEVGHTWASCGGSHSVGASYSDRVTFPGHTVATTQIVPKEVSGGPCTSVISGKVTNSGGRRVSVYRISDGSQVATGFTDPLGNWSRTVTMSPCGSAGGGYKVYADAPSGYQPAWYMSATSYASASCLDAPSSGNLLTLSASGPVTGYVKDATTAADINGASIYAYRPDGTSAGWATSGNAGPGRYSIPLEPGTEYRLKVEPPAGYRAMWFDGAGSYSAASPTAAPATANFSVAPATAYLTGYAKDASTAADLPDTFIYVYNSAGQFVASSKTNSSGRYQVPVDAAGSYKVLAQEALHENQWWDGASGYQEASATAPGTANFSLRPAGFISGTVTQSGQPLANAYVSAYTSCGCKTPQNAITGSNGQYTLKVPSTAVSGDMYRVRFIPPAGQTRWYSNSVGFTGATDISAPVSSIDQALPP